MKFLQRSGFNVVAVYDFGIFSKSFYNATLVERRYIPFGEVSG